MTDGRLPGTAGDLLGAKPAERLGPAERVGARRTAGGGVDPAGSVASNLVVWRATHSKLVRAATPDRIVDR